MEEKRVNNTVPKYNITGDANNKQNGFVFGHINDFTIYQFSNSNASTYFLAIPDNYNSAYQLFVAFPNKDLKTKPKKEILEEVTKIKEMITVMNKDGIYLLPDIPLDKLEEAARENDNKKFSQLLNDVITPIISDTYLRIKNYNNAERTVDQLIYFIKQTESDTKFIQWLEINQPNFIKGITYDEIRRYYYANVNNDEDKETDLDKTMVIPTEQLYSDPTIAKELESKEKVKMKIKTNPALKPNINNYGFGNMPLVIIILTVLVVVGLIISNLLLK